MTKNKEETEIVDDRTEEIIPKGAMQEITIASFPNTPTLGDFGRLDITKDMAASLAEPLEPNEVKIRPDGNVYVPWTYYAKRLNEAFGVAQWALIPNGMPLSRKGTYGAQVLIVWGHWFVIKGVPQGFAIGETTYDPTNAMMSYADACEGAKSSALSRNCKILGMTLELWDRDYTDEWKKKYAESYKDGDKTKWKKRPIVKQPVKAAAEKKGEQIVKVPMTLEQALQVKGADEIPYSKWPDIKLQHVLDSSAPADKKIAAKLILDDRKANGTGVK